MHSPPRVPPVTLSPSDWQRKRAAGALSEGPWLLGGRLLLVEQGALLLSDAAERLRVLIPEISRELGAELQAGNLVELLCQCSAQESDVLELVAVQSRAACPEPKGESEFYRLAATGRARGVQARHAALRAVRQYFEQEDFLEVQTPSFVPCPGLDPHVYSLAPVVRPHRTDYLITSPEFHMKRLLVGGLPRIYQVAACFRQEELGPWHEPAFTLIEWYRAFSDYTEMLRDTEELVLRVFEALRSVREKEAPGSPSPLAPFARFTVSEVFARYAGCEDVARLAEEQEEEYFRLWVEVVEPALAQLEQPVFITHYPASQAALARRAPEDPRYAERFELFYRGVELSNGFGELTDAAEQRLRFERELRRRRAQQEPEYPLDERFLAALEEGLPRSSGNALGLDRLIALALGRQEIQSTLAFPEQDR